MNRALRRISIAVLVMFVLLLINVNYLQGFDTASLASKPGNSRAFYAAQNQYQRGSIVTSDGKVIAASRLSSGNDSIKYQRYYPSGPEYAPVTGYFTIFGATGIEAAKNSLLSGNDSSLDVRKIIDLITGKTTKGATVQVTVNSKAQDAAWNALKALGKPGAVVALNPKTGAILAMASYPSFDPNVLAIHDGAKLNKVDNQLLRDKTQPLVNRALQGTYPPGSTFKIVTSSALLTQSPSTTINTSVASPTTLTLPQTQHILHNDQGEACGNGSGQAPLITAFAQSCDTTFAKIGIQVGANALNDMAGQFGMNNANLTVPLPVAKSNYVDTAQRGADRLLGDRPVQRHRDPAAGGHVRRGRRQRRHADEARPGAAGHRERPEHGAGHVAVGAQPLDLLLRVRQHEADDARRGAAAGGHGLRLPAGRHRRGDRRQDRHGRDRHGHEPERRRLHLLCPVRQPGYRRRRHNSGRRLRRLGGRTHRCAGHQGIPASRGESVSDYLLAGRYRLTDRIAAGGMGEVWRGEDDLLNRSVAVKLLPTGRAGDEAFLARFRAEARYAASLSHPGIARVYDYGESAEFGGAYLVMELVNGEPLSAILARAGRLSPDATLDIVSQAARALDAAHQAGIVHRDIKPGNLLVAAGGTTKITDFGIATAVAAAQASHLTETGMVMGTAMYVSPEQATGAQVTEASDIYSLGVVAFECLAGHPPFTASEPLAIAFAHKHEPVPALPPDVPQPVSDLVYHMLAKTPQERPGSVRLVADRADMLRDALALGEAAEPGYPGATRADLPTAATGALLPAADTGPSRGPGGFGYPRRASRRRQLVVAGSTAALCAAAAAAGLYLTGHISSRNSGNVDTNTAQHLSSPATTPSHQTSLPPPSTLTPTPSLSAQPPVTVPSPSGNPKPSKSVKPTKSPTSSSSTSPSTSGSGSSSPTDTGSATSTATSSATGTPT